MGHAFPAACTSADRDTITSTNGQQVDITSHIDELLKSDATRDYLQPGGAEDVQKFGVNLILVAGNDAPASRSPRSRTGQVVPKGQSRRPVRGGRVRLDARTSWHFRFHKPRSRRKRMAIGIGKPVDRRLCRFSVRLLLDPLHRQTQAPRPSGT